MKQEKKLRETGSIRKNNHQKPSYTNYRLNALLTMFLILVSTALLAQKPTVSIVVWDGKIKEGQAVGDIRIYQLGEPVPGLDVKIKCEGKAREGIDYRALGNSMKVDKFTRMIIRPILDGLVEGPEDLIIRILESDDYEIDERHSEVSLTIFDGDLPDIEFVRPSSVNDEAIEEAEVKIRLSGAYEKDIELYYSVQGVLAEEGDDFQFPSNRLLIPAGQSQASIKFQVKDDTVSEDDETVVIRLTGAENANIGTVESHYYTIRNDDGEPARSIVYDKIFGAVLGFRAGCAMGAITEYNWPLNQMEEVFGFHDELIPYKHYDGTWTHPAGSTEDGGERHKLICTAIIEKQDRINYQDLIGVWLRDCEIDEMYHMTQPYDRTLLSFARWGVLPEDMPVTEFGMPSDLGEHIHLTARTFQALPCINAGDPENAIADVNDIGKLYYEDPNDDAFAWGAVYNAAMALAMLPDATVESVIEGALEYATLEIKEEIRHALAITEKYDDPMNRDMWQELNDMYMDPDSKYYAFGRIEKYPNSSIYENVGYAFALFKATNGDVEQSVLIAVNRGYDTDCTAASAGALSGALSGTSKIPEDWIVTLDAGIANNIYTNAHFTNKATVDGLYRALQNKVYRMEKELEDQKINPGTASKVERKKMEDYVKLMKECRVIN